MLQLIYVSDCVLVCIHARVLEYACIGSYTAVLKLQRLHNCAYTAVSTLLSVHCLQPYYYCCAYTAVSTLLYVNCCCYSLFAMYLHTNTGRMLNS
jgi:hypothetical protein